MDNLIVRPVQNPSDLATVQQLWLKYWESLRLPLDFQGFGEELAGLPGAYSSPGGVLLLAFRDEEPAGTVALRRLNGTSGEVKRLYLRPEYRGQGVGRLLLNAVDDRANAIGYDRLFADTLPTMVEALRLYQHAGFLPSEPYSTRPTPGAIYLTLKLVGPGGTKPGSEL